MKQRVITGAGLVALLLILFFSRAVTPYIFDAFAILLAIYAGYEMTEILRKMGLYNNKWFVIIYPILAYILFKFSVERNVKFYLVLVMQIALIILLTAILSVVGIIAKNKTENEIKTRGLKIERNQFSIFKAIQTLFALVYPCLILIMLVFINNLPHLTGYLQTYRSFGNEMSLFFLIYVFVVPAFVDTFAMLTGALCKGPKLCPSISPKKTVSGAIGGFLWGTISAVALFYIFNSIETYRLIFITINLTWWKILIVGILSAVLCQLGDIFESYLKRKANVKDSGDFLPGHGGILDRIDSHIVNILIVFIFMLIL